MDLESEGGDDPLIHNAQEKTAKRTHHCLMAARLTFICSHGVLMIMSSIKLGWATQVDASWWEIFLPVWVGNATCVAMIIASWFASCPYIQLCLSERQARLGNGNPSILTELLPELIIAFLTFLCVILVFVGELLLCVYLGKDGEGSMTLCAVVLMIVSFLAFCHGVLIRTNGDLFNFVGGGVLVTLAIILTGAKTWVLLVPSAISTFGLLALGIRRLYTCGIVLSREERLLRIAEQCVLGVVLVALIALVITVSVVSEEGPEAFRGGHAAASGICAGIGVCSVAALRTRMAIVESRHSPIPERLVLLKSSTSTDRASGADVTQLPDTSGESVA